LTKHSPTFYFGFSLVSIPFEVFKFMQAKDVVTVCALVMLLLTCDLEDQCPQSPDSPEIKPAAIVNWYGISDVDDLLSGPDRKTYAVMWVGSGANRHEIAKQSSPLTYVRSGQPPVISIHGDHDDTVPYSQSESLKKALDQAGVKNELVTIPGGRHGGFSDEQTLRAFREIWKFLNATLPSAPEPKK
jgi:acetyl esterase/lipase